MRASLRICDGHEGGRPIGLDRRAGFSHLALQRRVPMRVAHLILEQAVALAHGFFVIERKLGMPRLKAQGHPVQKPPASFRAFDPKPIHGGDKPQHAGNAPQSSLRCGFAIDPDLPGSGIFGPYLNLVDLPIALQEARQFPAQCFGTSCHLFGTGTPEPAPRRKE